MIYNISVITTGLIVSFLLFFRFPVLKECKEYKNEHSISVIIPARNEERNLSLILNDLSLQTYPIHEIICVNDCSVDSTSEIAKDSGARVIDIIDKPNDWIGKSWACKKGSEEATGNIFLFLDADVRLKPNALASLVRAYDENNCVISVQPYHETYKWYEQFSMFFNLIQIAANGTSMIFGQHHAGLYGPVILIAKDKYSDMEGHTAAKQSIVDDLALGEKLTEIGLEYKLFLGEDHISFRMYGGGFQELLHGWTKNFATGALKTKHMISIMVFLWVTSCTAVSIYLLQSMFAIDLNSFVLFFVLYVIWVMELFRITRHIGNFKGITILLFPVYLTFFIFVFMASLIKKLFRLNVIWKDRKIKLEK